MTHNSRKIALFIKKMRLLDILQNKILSALKNHNAFDPHYMIQRINSSFINPAKRRDKTDINFLIKAGENSFC